MNQQGEIEFLREILKKCHVRSELLSDSESIEKIIDPWLGSIITVNVSPDATLKRLVGEIECGVKYKFLNELRLKYIIFRIPTGEERDILLIGPFLNAPVSSGEIMELEEELRLPTAAHRSLKEYFSSVPVISETDRLHYVIDTFCERIWQRPSFSIKEINTSDAMTVSAMIATSNGDGFDEKLADIQKMENRYAFENELMQAVVHGQSHKDSVLFSAFDNQVFEQRLSDPLRNAKNYCIIMNTLLRKAAEQGGVHPIYIDRVSSKLASKIELLSDVKIIPELMKEIFSSYCALVRKHSTGQYSPVVKKAILMIDSDVSAELSLHALAENQGISDGYLSAVFKRETGKNVSEYIREARVNRAIHLLGTTDLQIQTVAMHCGIMDAQYFTKIFKKQTGRSPNEYRELLRRGGF